VRHHRRGGPMTMTMTNKGKKTTISNEQGTRRVPTWCKGRRRRRRRSTTMMTMDNGG
jgi:hypothetical protein